MESTVMPTDHSLSDDLLGSRNMTDLAQHTDWDTVQLYVVMGILSFLSVMGTAGNAIVLYVFSQKNDKLVSTLFILALALVDFITCLIVIPYTIYMEYVYFFVKYDSLCKLYQFLITSNIPFSAMIMVAIAVDRYLCICHPFLHALNMERAKIMITVLAIFAIGLGVIVALMYGVYHRVKMPHNDTNFTDYTTIDDIMAYGSDMDYKTHTASYYTDNPDGWTRRNSFYDYPGLDMTVGNGNDTNATSIKHHVIVQFTGLCDNNELVLNATFQWYYQKFYTALYLVCLIVVIVLYILIYDSVRSRRTRRQKQKSKSLPLIQMSSERTEYTTEETMLTVATEANGESKPHIEIKNGSSRAREKESKEKERQRKKSVKKDRNRMANLKTAVMLFVVTVVFIVTFCPAFLMANGLINYNMLVFYMYFANNVANPVIYSFMNKNFREESRKLFCR